MTQTYLPPEVYCDDCGHYCHCDEKHCEHPIGVGMTDKWQTCKCEKCNCSNKRN